MAVDPRISLEARAPDLGQTFSNALLNISRIDALKQRREQAPLRSRLLEAQTQTAEAAVPTEQQRINQADINNVRSLATISRQIIPDLQAGNTDRVRSTLQQRFADLSAAGVSTKETQEGLNLLQNNPQELLRVAQDAVALDQQLSPGKAGVQFGAQQTFKDSKGNLFFGTTRRSPTTGQVESVLAPVTGGTAQPVGAVELVSGLGQTAAEKATAAATAAGAKEAAKLGEQLKTKPLIRGAETTAELEAEKELKPTVEAATAAAKQAITKSGKAFDRLEKINLNIANYDDAIAQLDAGAQTGAITSLFPSFKKATVALENIQGQLGLDVIGNTTFGALSESELKFALRTALPDKLGPEDLKRWLARKKEAQQKLSAYVAKAAQFLGTPGNTVSDWLELQQVNQIEAESPPSQVIRFDAQGNIIQ
jgi:hypothetical protein